MGSSVILPPPGQPVEGPDNNFTTGSTPNIVTFAFEGLGPPSNIYVQRDDKIRVKILNSVVGASYILSGRILLPIGPLPGQPDAHASDETYKRQLTRGFIQPIQQVFFPTSDRTPNEFPVELAEGYLLSLAFSPANAPAVARGQAYATIGLQRGGIVGNRFQQLIADLPANNVDIGWPGGTLRNSTDGPGFIHSIQQANPAAGSDFTFTAAAAQRLRIDSMQAQFAASAAVATRNVEIIVDDGANAVWTADVAAGITASTTDQIVATGTNAPTGVITTVQSIVLPPGLILAPGWRIRSVTQNIQAADQWSAIWFNVEEWVNT